MASHPTHSDIAPQGHDGGDGGAVRTYLRVFGSLLVLLFITVGIAFIPTGHHETLRDLLSAAGFLIAGTKAVLIVLWFMHVKAGTRLTWVFAASGFVWLVILFGLSLNDYLARDPLPAQGTGQLHQTGATGETQEYRPEGSSGLHYKR